MSVLSIYDCDRPFKRRKMDYRKAYSAWYALLANKVCDLFTWEGLPFEQREIEIRTQLFGNALCGIVFSRHYDRIIAAAGSGVGVTEYADKWINFVWACPGDSGISEIDKNCVLVRNNNMLIPTSILVQRYAHLLAHAELSLQAILINTRATGIIAARDEKQKSDIQRFYEALEDGKTFAIVDDQGLDSLIGSEGLRSVATAYPASTNIVDFWQIRQNLYKEFLAEIGISKSSDKKERLIQSEVEQDVPLYGYSLDDMLKCREDAAQKINDVFGLNVSVKINPIIEQIRKEASNDGTAEGEVQQ